MPADPAPENSVTGDDERRAEIEAVAIKALSEIRRRTTPLGDAGNRVAYELSNEALVTLDRVRRTPRPSSRERDTGTEAAARALQLAYRDGALAVDVASAVVDAYLDATGCRARDTGWQDPSADLANVNAAYTQQFERANQADADLAAAREQIEWLQDERRRWELRQGPTCHRCGNSWAARDQAEADLAAARARIEELKASANKAQRAVQEVAEREHARAETALSALRLIIDEFDDGHGGTEDDPVVTIARDALAAPPARNDEHGTENEG